MEDLDQSPLVSSSADSPPRPPPPAFQYQFVREPEDEEDEDEEDDEDEDEDLEELEVLERKPAAGLSAAPVPPATASPLLDLGSDSVPPAPRGPLPAAPPAAPERQPSWERSPTAPAPSLPAAAAVLPSKLPEDDEPPARPPPPPPAGVSPLAEPAAPPSTPAAPKRRGSGSVDENLFALPAASEPVIPSSAALISLFSIPVIYERHQVQIDHYLGLANKSVKEAMAKIQAKIPGLKRKTE
ncbi:Rtn4 [Phodopus roborovskii]|uniref:Rtn4 protein n=1 Tax=Phodopus roborovskii TaxID=109678 RepID=A0AAU9ZYA1_PHORO|nr:Rtn4 [Phodopus roborovskii]